MTVFPGQDVAIPAPEKAQQHSHCVAPLTEVKVGEDSSRRGRFSVVKAVNIYNSSWGVFSYWEAPDLFFSYRLSWLGGPILALYPACGGPCTSGEIVSNVQITMWPAWNRGLECIRTVAPGSGTLDCPKWGWLCCPGAGTAEQQQSQSLECRCSQSDSGCGVLALASPHWQWLCCRRCECIPSGHRGRV